MPWIRALLDEAPISHGDEKKSISPPPKFVFTANGDTSLPPPSATPRGRGRPRAHSPSKIAAPSNKASSPRKSRPSKAIKDTNATSAQEGNTSLQAALDSAASRADTDSVDGVDEEKVTVEVDSAVEVNGQIETTHTSVKVEMPYGSPDLALPESTEEMIAKAKEMVEEARNLEGESANSRTKRKAEVLDDDEDSAKDEELQPAKKARLLEQELKKQRVRTRALIGVAATLAIG